MWVTGLKVKLQKRVRLRAVNVQKDLPDFLPATGGAGNTARGPNGVPLESTAYVDGMSRAKLRIIFLAYCRSDTSVNRSAACMSAADFLRFARDARLLTGALNHAALMEVFERLARPATDTELRALRGGGGSGGNANTELYSGRPLSAAPRPRTSDGPAAAAAAGRPGSPDGRPGSAHPSSGRPASSRPGSTPVVGALPEGFPSAPVPVAPTAVLAFPDWLQVLTALAMKRYPEAPTQDAFDRQIVEVVTLAAEQEHSGQMGDSDALLATVVSPDLAAWCGAKRTRSMLRQVYQIYAQTAADVKRGGAAHARGAGRRGRVARGGGGGRAVAGPHRHAAQGVRQPAGGAEGGAVDAVDRRAAQRPAGDHRRRLGRAAARRRLHPLRAPGGGGRARRGLQLPGAGGVLRRRAGGRRRRRGRH